MHAGVTGRIRRTAIGRWLLFHANSGLFWIYGFVSFFLAFSLIGFCVQGIELKLLASLVIALVAAFTLPWLVHVLFWNRFHNVWMDNYVFVVIGLAILTSECAHDVRNGRDDVLWRLVERVMLCIVFVLTSYFMAHKQTQTHKGQNDAEFKNGASREV